MAELTEVKRTISGKGVILIPESYSDALDVLLYTEVLRPPINESRNFTFNPDKSFYAHITFCIDDFVLFSFDVNFKKQAFEIYSGQEAQNLLSLICAYDGILDSFVVIGDVLSTVISRVNLITTHPYLQFRPNRIRFECYAETALVLTLGGNTLARCRPSDGTPTPPIPPPAPVDEVPPGTPVTVSPPYEGEDDDGDTVPFPTDDLPLELPIEGECIRYLCTISYSLDTGGSVTREIVLSAPILDIFYDDRGDTVGYGIWTTCNGISGTGGECMGVTDYLIFNDTARPTSLTVISIVLAVEA